MAAISATRTVWVRMPDSMRAYTLRNSTVRTIIQRPFSHVMVGRIVDYAVFTLANKRQMSNVI